MKMILLSLALFASTNAVSATFDCTLSVNHGERVKLIQTYFAEDDEEENYEEYRLETKDIKALVGYFPFQDGLYLHLDTKDGLVSVETNQNDDNRNVLDDDLELKYKGNEFRLACYKN